MFSNGEMLGYFNAVDWLATTAGGWGAWYFGEGGGRGIVWWSWNNGVVMAVPNWEKEGGVMGVGWRVMRVFGWSIGRGAIVRL